MKYIKTKDGVYERLEPSEECPEVEDNYWLIVVNGIIHKDNEPIIAEADTIEELCDRFVAETCDNTKFWVEPTLENAKMYCGIKNIYGAIWTNKGLIYVAKMNDKGELELWG